MVLKTQTAGEESSVHLDAVQGLSFWTKGGRESFTSFCKNEGTDLLIFFKWSGSEKEEEEGVDIVETVE